MFRGFRGAHALNLDVKGRLAIPAKWREALMEHCEGQLVCTINRDRCLVLYPLPEWEVVEQQLAGLPSYNDISSEEKRMLIGHASEVELDGQGRVLLPALLRQFASIDRRAVLAGVSTKMELWNEEHWQERLQKWLDSDRTAMPEAMAELPV